MKTDLLDSDSSSSSKGSSTDDDSEHCNKKNAFDNQVKSMLSFLSEGGTKMKMDYSLGSSEWKNLWSTAINAMSGITGQRYRVRSEHGDDTLPDIFSSKSMENMGFKYPVLLEESSSSLKCNILPYPNTRHSNGSISEVVSILPHEKRQYMRRVLAKMETSFKKRDTTGVGLKEVVQKRSDKIQYAFENKIQYGRMLVVDKTAGTLRKIARALESPDMKSSRMDFVGVGLVCRHLIDKHPCPHSMSMY